MVVLRVVCFLLRTCGMCWLDSTGRSQQRLSAGALLSKTQISHWQLTKDMRTIQTQQSVGKRNLNPRKSQSLSRHSKKHVLTSNTWKLHPVLTFFFLLTWRVKYSLTHLLFQKVGISCSVSYSKSSMQNHFTACFCSFYSKTNWMPANPRYSVVFHTACNFSMLLDC